MRIYEFECIISGFGISRAKTWLRMSGKSDKEAINNLNRVLEIKYTNEMLLWFGSPALQELTTEKSSKGITIKVKKAVVLEYTYTKIDFLDEI